MRGLLLFGGAVIRGMSNGRANAAGESAASLILSWDRMGLLTGRLRNVKTPVLLTRCVTAKLHGS